MASTTPNYGWPVPDGADVPDGAGQMTALGNAIDADMAAQRSDLEQGIAGAVRGKHVSQSTDGNGEVVVSHGLGQTPAWVACTSTSGSQTPLMFVVTFGDVNATTVTVRAHDTTSNVTYKNSPVSFYFVAGEN